jgi:DNA-binding transcriptional regulator YiaG
VESSRAAIASPSVRPRAPPELCYRDRPMTPDDLKALRKELSCTARELAGALGIEQETVLAWERGELFPTKRYVDAMQKLRQAGPSAIPRKPKRSAAPATPWKALADPATWRLVRKLLAHAALRARVEELAAAYDDPAEE